MHDQKQNLIIFSLPVSDLGLQLLDNIRDRCRESKAKFLVGVGKYKGFYEPRYIVEIPAETRDNGVLRARLVLNMVSAVTQAKEESIISVDADRNVILHYMDGQVTPSEPLGKLTWFKPELRNQIENWTRIGENYYTTTSELS